MQNHLDNQKNLKNEPTGDINIPKWLENVPIGSINIPTFHLVDIKEVTPIIRENWLSAILFGLGVFNISKVIEIYYNNEQYSNICKYAITASIFIVAGLVFQHIFITKKYRELKNKAISVTYGEYMKFIFSLSTAGDTRKYRDSTKT